MTNAREKLRRGKPAEEIEDQSQPVREDDPERGEQLAEGTGGGAHKTGANERPPPGKGNLGS